MKFLNAKIYTAVALVVLAVAGLYFFSAKTEVSEVVENYH